MGKKPDVKEVSVAAVAAVMTATYIYKLLLDERDQSISPEMEAVGAAVFHINEILLREKAGDAADARAVASLLPCDLKDVVKALLQIKLAKTAQDGEKKGPTMNHKGTPEEDPFDRMF